MYARTRLSADVRIRPDVSLSVITAFLYYSMLSYLFFHALCHTPASFRCIPSLFAIRLTYIRLLYLFLPFLEMFSRDFMAIWFEMIFSHT